MKNFLFVVEGIDNSGKTTLIEHIKRKLNEGYSLLIRNYFRERIYFTSEPYGTLPTSLKYKRLSEFVFSEEYKLKPETEALIFLAARNEHISSFIIPKLQEKSLIFCDRFHLSSLVYQSFLKGVDLNWLDYNHSFFLKTLRPRITFIVEVEEKRYDFFSAQKRLKGKANKYDDLPLSYSQLVEGYNLAIKHLQKQGEEFVVLSSSLSFEEKALKVIKTIEKLIQ